MGFAYGMWSSCQTQTDLFSVLPSELRALRLSFTHRLSTTLIDKQFIMTLLLTVKRKADVYQNDAGISRTLTYLRGPVFAIAVGFV